jgi:hypothetical protein
MSTRDSHWASLALLAGGTVGLVLVTRRISARRQEVQVSKADVLALRKQYTSSAQSMSYLNSDPLMIVKVSI